MPKAKPTDAIADVLRDVAMSLEKAYDDGARSQSIDMWDLVETLLAIADRLDPPTRTATRAGDRACLQCGEHDIDALVWIDDQRVRCASCGHEYAPTPPNARHE